MTRPLSFLPNFDGDNVTDVSNRSQGLSLFREAYNSRLLVCNILTRTYAEIELDLSDKLVHIIQGMAECTLDLNSHPITMAPLMSVHGFSMVSYGSSILVVATFDLDTVRPSGLFVLSTGNPPNRTGIVIYELYEEEEEYESVWNWREFVRIPSQSLPQNYHLQWWQPKCVCVGDYLCFGSECEDRSAIVFAYNLRERVWQNLSPSDNRHINWTIMRRMMSCEPNFSV